MKKLLLLLFCIPILHGWSQDKATVSGSITDKSNGEELIGSTIFVKDKNKGTVTNLYGFYSLTLPKGNYTLIFSFVGYESLSKEVDLNDDLKLNVEMALTGTNLEEFKISAEAKDKNVESVEMSTVNMQIETIKKIPALMGEVDLIKAIQLLPGVQTVGEGGSGFYVRGGGVDQNLIILDESPVYNASHLMGFFSVFNSDAIKDVKLYKGGIPAEYGGRLSSVLDIRMKDGNSKSFSSTGGIGNISSRLTLEAPIVKNKSSFMISGRRTYADQFLRFSKNEAQRKSKLYFYDLNTKLNYKLSDKDKLFLSGYFGRDVFGFSDQFKMSWGNATGTLRWNHIFNNRLFVNTSLMYSNFDYSLGAPQGTQAFEWKSNIQGYTGKVDFNYFLNPENTLKFGVISTYHQFDPGKVKGIGNETIFNELDLGGTNALEHAIYAGNEHKFTPRLTATYGVRWSAFQNIGASKVFKYDSNHNVIDTINYKQNEIYKTYHGLEPRAGVKYSLTASSSIKASYNRMRQYVHLASNSTASSPLDIWFPSSPEIKPRIADQVALGFFKNIKENIIETSVEVYYKEFINAIDFKDHAQLLLNEKLEGELRIGEGRSYGLELLIKKQRGNLTGFISYTLARSEKKIPEILKTWFPAKYDKTHDLAFVLSYDFSKRFNVAANWIYSTGPAVTMPTGKIKVGNTTIPIYSEKNAERLPSYHRLDLAATIKGKIKPGKKWNGEWVISIYNAYRRHNVYSINFVADEDNPNKINAEKLYLFDIIPSVTYNFKFN